ncbi:unnamed protein product, partial [Symbiodinium sp. CCMP2456]
PAWQLLRQVAARPNKDWLPKIAALPEAADTTEELAALDALQRHSQAVAGLPHPLQTRLRDSGVTGLAAATQAYALLRVRDNTVLSEICRRTQNLAEKGAFVVEAAAASLLLDALGKLAARGEAARQRRRTKEAAPSIECWRATATAAAPAFAAAGVNLRLIDLASGLSGLARLRCPEVLPELQQHTLRCLASRGSATG